jgi:hypothetical protein
MTYASKDNVAHVLSAQHIRLADERGHFYLRKYIFKTTGPATPVTTDQPIKSIYNLWADYEKYMAEENNLNKIKSFDSRSLARVANYTDAAWNIVRENRTDDAPSEPVRDKPEAASPDDSEAETAVEEKPSVLDNDDNDDGKPDEWDDELVNKWICGDADGIGEGVWNKANEKQKSADFKLEREEKEIIEIAEIESLLKRTKLEQEQIEAEQELIQLSYVECLEGSIDPPFKYEISPFDDSDYDYDSDDFGEASSESD